jgi:hypothetical protein
MSKPWRMVALHAGAWATLALVWTGRGDRRAGPFTVLDLTCIVIVVGCVQTIWVRLAGVMRELRSQP